MEAIFNTAHRLGQQEKIKFELDTLFYLLYGIVHFHNNNNNTVKILFDILNKFYIFSLYLTTKLKTFY